MVPQEREVSGIHPRKSHVRADPESCRVVMVRLVRKDDATVIAKADETSVEQAVEVGGQQDAVEGVKPLMQIGTPDALVPRTIAPRRSETTNRHTNSRLLLFRKPDCGGRLYIGFHFG